MNSLRELWGNRFGKYAVELQRYLQYVFTGHLAIVLLFSIGAAGYAYSEWLKDVPEGLPVIRLVAILLAGSISMATTVTLLRPADAVYLLPLEKELPTYTRRALTWTFVSKLPLPIILFIISLPLLNAYQVGSKSLYLIVFIVLVLATRLQVLLEFSYRKANDGKSIWKDRLVRFIVTTLILYYLLSGQWLLFILVTVLLVIYFLYWKQRGDAKPFPYMHFIELEQNRMMRFYRFANYFTEVPHLKGTVSKRSWLSIFMPSANMENANAQSFLLRRTFMRTDEIFWLWLRLTILSILGALFIPFPILVFLFVGALAFASTIQTLYSLRGGEEFRMDMLHPHYEVNRQKAIYRLTSRVQWIQAGSVVIALLFQQGVSIVPLLSGAVILIVSEATIRLAGNNE